MDRQEYIEPDYEILLLNAGNVITGSSPWEDEEVPFGPGKYPWETEETPID